MIYTTQMFFIGASILLWLAIVIYWIQSSKKNSAGHIGNEIISFIKLSGSALLIYLPLLTGGPMASVAFKPDLILEVSGLIFCLAGTFTMVWARIHLGKNWSGNVILQKEHTLVETGPYKWLRHPIYSGLLLAMLGSAIILGMAFGLVWVLFCLIGLTRKMLQEEKLLQNQFHAKYAMYKKQSKRLIPYVW